MPAVEAGEEEDVADLGGAIGRRREGGGLGGDLGRVAFLAFVALGECDALVLVADLRFLLGLAFVGLSVFGREVEEVVWSDLAVGDSSAEGGVPLEIGDEASELAPVLDVRVSGREGASEVGRDVGGKADVSEDLRRGGGRAFRTHGDEALLHGRDDGLGLGRKRVSDASRLVSSLDGSHNSGVSLFICWRQTLQRSSLLSLEVWRRLDGFVADSRRSFDDSESSDT